jgi:hypothetical protein
MRFPDDCGTTRLLSFAAFRNDRAGTLSRVGIDPQGLRLLEHQEGVGVNPIPLHRLSSLVALHRFLKRAEVGDLEDQSDPV